MKVLCILIGLIVFSCTGVSLAQGAADGTTLDPARTIIVRAATPPAPKLKEGQRPPPNYIAPAAGMLRKYLQMACGVTEGFEIVTESANMDVKGKFVLALGPTKWAEAGAGKDLWQDGYVIKRTGDVVSISGGQKGGLGKWERGTLHGAAGFLERFAGVRFYMPGDLWTSLPASKKVVVPAKVDIRFEPYVKVTSVSGMWGPPGSSEWIARNGMNTRRGSAGTHQHNMWNVFPPDKYAKTHPELYPLVGGKRYIPKDRKDQRWNPCFSSPQTLDAAEKSALAFFAKHPNYIWFSLGLQDSNASCECPKCKAAFAELEKEITTAFAAGNPQHLTATYTANPEKWKDPRGKMTAARKWLKRYALSQLQWRMINELAKRLETKAPGKQVEALAYGITCFAPTFKLQPNCLLYAQIHVSDNVRGLMEPRADGSLPLDIFIDASINFGNHEWYRGEGYLVPRIYSGYWTKFMRHQKKKGKVTYHHAEAYPNWGLDGAKYWVLAQTFQDPDRDPKALWRRFCDDMFGPAGEPMAKYFNTLEEWFMDQSVVKGPKWKIGGYTNVFQRPSADDLKPMRQARKHLDAAAKLVKTDQQTQRLELCSKTFRLTEMLFELGTLDPSPEKAAAVKKYYNEKIQPDQMTIAARALKDKGFIDKVIKAVTRKRRPAKK